MDKLWEVRLHPVVALNSGYPHHVIAVPKLSTLILNSGMFGDGLPSQRTIGINPVADSYAQSGIGIPCRFHPEISALKGCQRKHAVRCLLVALSVAVGTNRCEYHCRIWRITRWPQRARGDRIHRWIVTVELQPSEMTACLFGSSHLSGVAS